MAIVHQKDHRSGLTYAYEAKYYWDKEKKQSRCKRTLIGRVDDITGEIVPTDGRNKKAKERKEKAKVEAKKRGPVPITNTAHYYCGATYLFDRIGEEIGITGDLRSCFPHTYKQIISIVYFLILEENNPLYRFEKWNAIHKHPYGDNIPSQRSSELFCSITDENISNFFRLQGKRRIENEYWAYDSTSISSYSEELKQIKYGHNKEDDKLAQLNLLLLFGEKSGLPFYYRKLAGNIPDVKTVRTLITDLDVLGYEKVKVVMDRGFCSKDNINALYKEHIKFLMSSKINLKFIKKYLDPIYDEIRTFKNYDKNYNIYGVTVPAEWDYEQERPYRYDAITEKRRMYLQFYCNNEKRAEDEVNFDQKVAALYDELINEKRIESHEKLYAKYFYIKKTPKRGIQIEAKEDVFNEEKKYFGYFVLITNEKMDAMSALSLYRSKDIVEKGFGNIKERLNSRRLLVSSERSLEGKLFVQFVALIYLSHINKTMRQKNLYTRYTMQQLLDKVDVIECFENPGYEPRFGEILKEQESIYAAFDCEAPSS